MNRLTRLIVCSMLIAAPVVVSAQGNAGQMGGGPMMNEEQMQKMHQNMSQMQEMMESRMNQMQLMMEQMLEHQQTQ